MRDERAVIYAPSMSDQSFMKGLFHGIISEELVIPYPERSQEERDSINLMLEQVRRFCTEQVDAAKIDREHTSPKR